MIDFNNAQFVKLTPVTPDRGEDMFRHLLLPNEEVLQSFRSIRDMVVFTDRRIISVNVQGITGKKKDFTSIPYSRVQAFSVESAGTFDWDTELDIFISSIGRIRFEFTRGYDVATLSRYIAAGCL